MVNNKRRHLLCKGIVLFHDNLRPKCAAATVETIRQPKFEIIPHTPYYPNLVPGGYHVLRTAKTILTRTKI